MTTGTRFSVKPFSNPRSGTESFRVQGIDNAGRRVRINFALETEALAKAAALEAEGARDQAARAPRLLQTRLTDAELLATESAVNSLPEGRTLADLLAAGAEALARSPHRVALAPLVEEWLEVMKREVTADWLRDLRHRVRGFLKLHPGLTTDRFTRGLVRKWVDDMPQASQTRANYRGAVRRFGAWLVERGYLEENPAAELRINTAKERNANPPTVLSLAQARGLAWAVTAGPARPMMGWVALSLLCGLRPQMEAPHLAWSEIDFKRGVVLAMGRKRGARAREVPMSKAAREWLRSVKDAGEEKPAMFNRYWLRVAVRETNAWLKKHQPKATPLKWSGDILRHTYASAQAASGVGMPVLAAQMGNSTEVIHAFYRAPMLKAHAAEIMALPVD